MMFPTIHMNGDTQDTLYLKCSYALDAMRMAEKALRNMEPNERNYYPQGSEALGKAMAEHFDRRMCLLLVRQQLEAMLEAIVDGGHKEPSSIHQAN